MATSKTTKKVVVVRTADRDSNWQLGRTRMIAANYKIDDVQHYFALDKAEVRRVLTAVLVKGKDNVKFRGLQEAKTTLRGHKFLAYKRLNGISFGCQHFTENGTKKLAKWAGVTLPKPPSAMVFTATDDNSAAWVNNSTGR